MSYQVLARKWRPKNFKEMVGQEHVLRALINALENNRLHHAYLFTGTRGVGKTTIARILAKCLNCEEKVTAEPCGECGACLEIADGRFIDLIEVDAASKTKVEDTRELLENVQYAPTNGRYKVYLIDEVHMLTTHSFNALLKTLEEPPPHVKFLLATTDPQKLPVTILSRCLQFNLKNMTPERIVDHLKFILQEENVDFEEPALWQLGRAADGSMRDALSLTDQAIAFGRGHISDSDVAAMLGAIDQGLLYGILEALAAFDGAKVLGAVEHMSQFAPDYGMVLTDLLSLLHRITIAQVVPDAVSNAHGDRDKVIELAGQLTGEDVQLFYQLGLVAQRDLPLAPDPRSGLEMALLRMLAFKPQGVVVAADQTVPATTGATAQEPDPVKKPQQTSAAETRGQLDDPGSPVADSPVESPVSKELPPANPAPQAVPSAQQSPQRPPQASPQAAPPPAAAQAPNVPPPFDDGPPPAPRWEDELAPPSAAPESPSNGQSEPALTARQQANAELAAITGEVGPVPPPVEVIEASSPVTWAELSSERWFQVCMELAIKGVLKTVIANCEIANLEGNKLQLTLDEQHATLFNESHVGRLAKVLTDYFGSPVDLTIIVGTVKGETPAARVIRYRQERHRQAVVNFKQNSQVLELMDKFSGEMIAESIRPEDT